MKRPLVLMALMGIGLVRALYANQDFEMRIVSSRPEAVSGGEVLTQISVPQQPHWRVWLNGREVTPSFHPAAQSGKFLALLNGLELGKNVIEIRAHGVVRSKIEILNHPLAGPVFSGPHQQPFLCQTEANGLGAALDADCAAKTIIQYYYKSTQPAPSSSAPGSSGDNPYLDPGFKPYQPSDPLPADVARTVTANGREVPYLVRREIGTINRAIYDIQFLHPPGEPLPTPWTAHSSGWNGRLMYEFLGGCGPGYHQGRLESVGRAQEPLLARGYAVATSTLNSFGNTCNDNISAETVSMVKEHFIKHFGVPVYTIGYGGSGGAIQAYLIAQNYPGLLDAIVAKASFPDEASHSSDAGLTLDCILLDRAFKAAKPPWTEAQKTSVSGFATWRTCAGWGAYNLPIVDPKACGPWIPKESVYDPIVNPKGARCDLYDNEINVFGRDPRTGFARRPLDNVGVQYGLKAFNNSTIDAEQFVELNERIGSFDADGHFVAQRAEADAETLAGVYQRGLVLTGGGGLAQVPIIDVHTDTDDIANVHDRVRSFVTRARLTTANGSAENQVILVEPRAEFLELLAPRARFWDPRGALLHQIDDWLERIAADQKPGTALQKIARNKPAELSDGCWTTEGERIVERASYEGAGRCNRLYPAYGDPRIAAGGPLTDDVLKCALKPIREGDYAQSLTAAQLERLRAVFPTGVCDYSRPGVGQQVIEATWQRY